MNILFNVSVNIIKIKNNIFFEKFKLELILDLFQKWWVVADNETKKIQRGGFNPKQLLGPFNSMLNGEELQQQKSEAL